jgi:hypothetical protein
MKIMITIKLMNLLKFSYDKILINYIVFFILFSYCPTMIHVVASFDLQYF